MIGCDLFYYGRRLYEVVVFVNKPKRAKWGMRPASFTVVKHFRIQFVFNDNLMICFYLLVFRHIIKNSLNS